MLSIGRMDVIAATFEQAGEATSAARELESALDLEDGVVVAVDPLPTLPAGSAGPHPVRADVVLIAYVPEDERATGLLQ